MSSQTLSFRLRIATTAEDLLRACETRQLAYGHHSPNLGSHLAAPDAEDKSPQTAVFLCEDKVTGAAIGTARIRTTSRGARLAIEDCVALPESMARQGRAEITRLAVRRGADPLVRLALWKAGYLYCHATQSRWLLIGARSDSLLRHYMSLGARHIHDHGRKVMLGYTGGIEHYTLAFDVIAAERSWQSSAHRMYGFMFETVHADIDIFSTASPITAPLAIPADADQLARHPSAANEFASESREPQMA